MAERVMEMTSDDLSSNDKLNYVEEEDTILS